MKKLFKIVLTFLTIVLLLSVYWLESNIKASCISTNPSSSFYKSNIKLHHIDVNWGDAFLITCEDHAIMIDGGKPKYREQVLNYLKKQGISNLDAYIATHYHYDHVGNAGAILTTFATPKTFVFGPSKELPERYYIPEGKGMYKQLRMKDVYTFGKIKITCVGPYEVTANGKENSDSLNIIVEYENTKFYMTGDGIQYRAFEENYDLIKDVDVFKATHHGWSNLHAFFNTTPKYMLIPNWNVATIPFFSLLKPTKLYCSGAGNFVIESDGNNISIFSNN